MVLVDNFFRLGHRRLPVKIKNIIRKSITFSSRVVQTQSILFLKSMSENGESDIERRKIWMSNRFLVDLEIQFQSPAMSDPTLSDNDFKNKMILVWNTLKVPWSDLLDTHVSQPTNRKPMTKTNSIPVVIKWLLTECSLI